MSRFNLSAWAIAHRSIVYFLMAALVVLGISSYLRLGRNEDPTFTIKTMVVQAQWPGATLHDTLLQVTERIERKLQETPQHDYLKSYTNAGKSTVFVYLKGSTGPKEVSDTWYQVRKKVKDIELTLPPGVIGPVADDEFGDTYGIIYGFTAHGFTSRELRDYVEDIRSRLLQVPDGSKVNLIGAQPERIYIQFSPAKLAGYGLTPASLMAALQAQNIVVPSGVITTEAEAIKLRVSGALRSEKDVLAVNFAVGERIIRLADIAQVQREDADPPDPIFRINGKPGLGLAISMRDGGDVLAALYQPLSFTALGATGKNDEINFEAQGITLAQALGRVNGLQDARSDARGLRHARRSHSHRSETAQSGTGRDTKCRFHGCLHKSAYMER
jgi:multidrug efflux pump subunit AcrB